LKIKVRALPTWRNPVGDGAKRTRGLDESKEAEVEESFSGISGETLMVWGQEKYRQANREKRFSVK